MSMSLHLRTSRLPEINKQDRAWWIEFLFYTGLFDTIDISEILDISEPEACILLHEALEPR